MWWRAGAGWLGQAPGSRHRVTGGEVGEPLLSPAVLCKRWRRGRGGGTLCGQGSARPAPSAASRLGLWGAGAARPAETRTSVCVCVVGRGSGRGTGGDGPVWAGEACVLPARPRQGPPGGARCVAGLPCSRVSGCAPAEKAVLDIGRTAMARLGLPGGLALVFVSPFLSKKTPKPNPQKTPAIFILLNLPSLPKP